MDFQSIAMNVDNGMQNFLIQDTTYTSEDLVFMFSKVEGAVIRRATSLQYLSGTPASRNSFNFRRLISSSFCLLETKN